VNTQIAWLKIPIVGISLLTLPLILICQDRRVEFDLGCLKIPDVVVKGNASFSIIYRCEINAKGKAKKIHLVADRFLKPGKVSSCLKKWRFVGFPPRDEYTVSLVWRHGRGWARLAVSNREVDFKLDILAPGRGG